jgi:hypothetical protein
MVAAAVQSAERIMRKIDNYCARAEETVPGGGLILSARAC